MRECGPCMHTSCGPSVACGLPRIHCCVYTARTHENAHAHMKCSILMQHTHHAMYTQQTHARTHMRKYEHARTSNASHALRASLTFRARACPTMP